MHCPRCQTFSQEDFCPQCGLDLAIRRELQTLKEEVAGLSAELARYRVSGGRDQERGDEKTPSTSEQTKTLPPPLPGTGTPGPVRLPSSGSREASEIAVGQKWFLGLGVLTLLLGAGFFLKYAFDSRWIGPSVQVTLGFITGSAALFLGELCRRRGLKGLDIGIAALGLGFLYLSAFAGCQLYQLLPDWLTLILTLIITAVGIIVAYVWDSRGVAFLSLLGGYLAPLLLISERLSLFFIYLAVLNLAGQLLAFTKRWSFLYTAGATLSWISFYTWTLNHDVFDQFRLPWTGQWTDNIGHHGHPRFAEAFAFTQVLFVLYSIAPFLRGLIREKEKVSGFWVGIVSGLLCCWQSAYLLDFVKANVAIVTLGYAAITLALGIVAWRQKIPSLAATWLTAEGMTFLLVTWAILLSATWITVFWAAQTVALYWVAAKGRDRILLNGTIVLGVLVAFRYLVANLAILNLGFNLTVVPGSAQLGGWHGVFTAGWPLRAFTALTVIASCFAIVWLDSAALVNESHRDVSNWFEALGIVSLFAYLNVELGRFTSQFFQRATLAGYSVLWALFAAGLLGFGLWKKRRTYRVSAIVLLFLTIGKVLLFDTAQVSAPYRILSCVVLGAVLVCLSSLYYRFSDRALGR
jgi:uncharacterized membrane protein